MNFSQKRKGITTLYSLLCLLSMLFATATVSAQDRMLTGTIKDSGGITLPGVNILVVGTSVGTTTAIDGTFKLSMPTDVSNPFLKISAVGYKTIEIEVGTQTNFDLKLEDDVSQLEEVVVVGYGKQNKAFVTSAVSNVKTADLENYSAGSVENSLSGRIAGVNVIPSGGSPGAGIKIRVRGTGSNGNSDPLYIVDGMRVPNIDFLDPLEIGSLQVLKDAASSAIYGAEGANGVVYVTTKEGKAGKTNITYDMQYGLQSFDSRIEMMNLEQFDAYWTERGATRNHTPMYETNWLDEVFEVAPQQRHALTFSGGNDKSKYFVSGNYFNQDGIIGGDKAKFERFSIRLNASHQMKDWLTISHNASYANFKRNNILENDSYGGIAQSAILMDPAAPVTFGSSLPDYVLNDPVYGPDKTYQLDNNGNYYGVSTFTTGEAVNPVAKMDSRNNEAISDLFMGAFKLSAEPIHGFSINSRLGLTMLTNSLHTWEKAFFYSNTAQNNQPNSYSSISKSFNYQWENWLSYDKRIGVHDFNLILGTSIYATKHTYVAGQGSPLFGESDELSYMDAIPNGRDNTQAFGNEQITKLQSYYGRLQYNYDQRYLLGVTVRTDGSSLLSEGLRWGIFPSVSAGWIISNESFFDVDAIAFAKLRASWGRNGSLSNLYPGAAIGLVSPTFQYTNGENNQIVGAEPVRLTNSELTWETSDQWNIGLDLGFFDDRLTFTADYFNKTTMDLLNVGTPPGYIGNFAPIVNSGTVVNKGFEIALGYNGQAGDFKYGFSANITKVVNEVTEIDPNKERENGADIANHWKSATAMEEGYPIWYFRGYKTDGIFQSQTEVDAYTSNISGYNAAPGDPVIVDMNGDGQITPADFTEIGSPHPDFMLGFNAKAEYKGFDLTIFAQGSFGNDVVIGYVRNDIIGANYPASFYEDRWTESNPTNDWFRSNANGLALSTDYMIADGSYLKIRQLQLGYNLPETALDKLGLGKARIYVSLDNFFTFTGYDGFDPEVGGSSNDNSLGIDRGVYPTPRVMMTGLSLRF